MQHISGLTLPDLIDKLEFGGNSFTDIDTIAQAVIEWLAKYYDTAGTRVTGLGRGDINGRNFIFDDGQVWGVDFEEPLNLPQKPQSGHEAIETDIGRLMAFVLNYDPPNTPFKKDLSESLLLFAVKMLDIDPKAAQRHCTQEVEAMAHRRR
jgi:hypothetical protein